MTDTRSLSESLTSRLTTPVPKRKIPSEAIPPEQSIQLRAELRARIAATPKGAKRQLARTLGFTGRWCQHHMMAISQGRMWLLKAQERRIRSGLTALQRGEIILQETGMRGPGYQSHRFVHRSEI